MNDLINEQKPEQKKRTFNVLKPLRSVFALIIVSGADGIFS